MTRKITALFLIILLFAAYNIYAMGSTPARKYIPVRIRIISGAKDVNVSVKSPYRISDLTSGEVLNSGKASQNLFVSPESISDEGIKISTDRPSYIYVNGRQFRGIIDIIKDQNNKVSVVNHVDLEEYLYGVLYHEVNHNWPMEALKAQAIAARTYALYQKLISGDRFYDLTADIYSQVYGGRTSEKRRVTRAVDLTRGTVLTYRGKVFPSYFHATCGGSTTDSSTLWNVDIPVLRGRPCNFCDISPHYNWHKELTVDHLESAFKKAGYEIPILSIEILERDSSGRILSLLVKGKGKDIRLTGNKFRLIVGPNVIRSSNFEVDMRGKYVTFRGKGWGHGVGMCQWGAFNMSTQGWKAEDILQYYYPGSEIIRVE